MVAASRDRAKICNFRSMPGAGVVLAARSEALQNYVAAMPEGAQLAAICDTRVLHASLFAGLAPLEFPDAPGTYRGTQGTSVASAPRAVFLAQQKPGLRRRDLCLDADGVAAAMQDLAIRLRDLAGTPVETSAAFFDATYIRLAGVTARFFAIHPYMDGNGHIWRLILPVLARRCGLTMRPEWTINQRPYGTEFSLALQWYQDHPILLADQLRRWLSPAA